MTWPLELLTTLSKDRSVCWCPFKLQLLIFILSDKWHNTHQHLWLYKHFVPNPLFSMMIRWWVSMTCLTCDILWQCSSLMLTMVLVGKGSHWSIHKHHARDSISWSEFSHVCININVCLLIYNKLQCLYYFPFIQPFKITLTEWPMRTVMTIHKRSVSQWVTSFWPIRGFAPHHFPCAPNIAFLSALME